MPRLLTAQFARNDLACNRGKLTVQFDSLKSSHLPKCFHDRNGRIGACSLGALMVV
jgi:hypothetical protein